VAQVKKGAPVLLLSACAINKKKKPKNEVARLEIHVNIFVLQVKM
jgi:hypothetical protein